MPRPFLKWVGGKSQLLEQFQPLLPQMHGRYFEPFVGGAALFFALRPPRASLRDVNKELIDCYAAVRDDVEGVIEGLLEHTYERDHYYAVRDVDTRKMPIARRAARTIFLNKTGFNGLYRVNRSGKFNVPFGRYNKPNFCDPDNLRACSVALQGVSIEVRDFRKIVKEAEAGDFVYFDPPYVPVSETSDFTSYAAGGFSMEMQTELADVFRVLTEKKVLAMLSNSDTPEVRSLYAGFMIDEVHATRSVNSDPTKRGKVAEVVVRNYRRASDSVARTKRRVQRVAFG